MQKGLDRLLDEEMQDILLHDYETKLTVLALTEAAAQDAVVRSIIAGLPIHYTALMAVQQVGIDTEIDSQRWN